MITINIKADVQRLQRQLDDFAKRQVPFAVARALTEVAKKVQRDVTASLPQVLNKPSPFTMNTFAVKAATKASPTAIVYARPVQAAYLAPEEFGLPQAHLTPIDIVTNSLGNLPKGVLATLKGRPDVFVGTVRGIYGVWQRVIQRGDAHGQRTEFRRRNGQWVRARARQGEARGLRLLLRFRAPVVPRTQIGFRDRARKIIEAEIAPELRQQLAEAIRTAR